MNSFINNIFSSFDLIKNPCISFCVAWFIVSQTYAVFDIKQPRWYKKICCANNEDYVAMTRKVYFVLLVDNMKNLFLAFIVYLALTNVIRR